VSIALTYPHTPVMSISHSIYAYLRINPGQRSGLGGQLPHLPPPMMIPMIRPMIKTRTLVSSTRTLLSRTKPSQNCMPCRWKQASCKLKTKTARTYSRILSPVWGRGTPLPPCPFTSSSFPPFTFLFLSFALPIFFFCPSLPFLPE